MSNNIFRIGGFILNFGLTVQLPDKFGRSKYYYKAVDVWEKREGNKVTLLNSLAITRESGNDNRFNVRDDLGQLRPHARSEGSWKFSSLVPIIVEIFVPSEAKIYRLKGLHQLCEDALYRLIVEGPTEKLLKKEKDAPIHFQPRQLRENHEKKQRFTQEDRDARKTERKNLTQKKRDNGKNQKEERVNPRKQRYPAGFFRDFIKAQEKLEAQQRA